MQFNLQSRSGQHSFIFDTVRDDDELPDTMHYYIGLSHMACVHVEIDLVNKYAILQRIAIDGKLDNIVMLGQSALKFIAGEHPDLLCVSLSDDAEKALPNGKQIAVTPRLLLQGNQGWYQKHFGALPTSETTTIIKALHKNHVAIDKYLPITTQTNWGSSEEIIVVARDIIPQYSNRFLTTTWTIPLATIKNYDVDVNLLQTGGAKKKRCSIKQWYINQSCKKRLHVHTYV